MMQLSGAKQAIYDLIKKFHGLPAYERVRERPRVEVDLAEVLLYLIRSANRVGIDLVAVASQQLSRDAERLPRAAPELRSFTSVDALAAVEPLRILIVEDERIVAADLQEVLNGFGYDAYAVASCGAEALEIARKKRPDVTLMDICVDGDLDGIETGVRLRRECGTAVIFITAHADDVTVQRAKRSDPDAFLIKPVSARALRTTIEVVAHRHQQRLAV
jgi:CheY-like chemotaxis protein